MLFTETTTVGTSYLIKSMNGNAAITSRVLEVIKNGTRITDHDIEEQILQIRKTRISPLAERVIDAFMKGRIRIIFSEQKKVVQAIPFIVVDERGNHVAYIFANGYGTFSVPKRASDMEKVFDIGMKDLYALMEGAYVAVAYYDNPTMISRDIGLLKICANIYTTMMTRLFNRYYSLSMDETQYNQVSYCTSRFFLDHLWEVNSSELSHAYSFGTILNPNRMDYVMIRDEWDNAGIDGLDTYVEFLQTHFTRMSKLTVRFLTECFMNTYRPTVVLAMDVLPYFLFAVSSAMLGSYIANQSTIYDIARNTKGINNYYSELSKIL